MGGEARCSDGDSAAGACLGEGVVGAGERRAATAAEAQGDESWSGSRWVWSGCGLVAADTSRLGEPYQLVRIASAFN